MSLDEGDVRAYYRFWVNTLAQEIRKCGVPCSDKEFSLPTFNLLESILKEGGVEGFFENDLAVVLGLDRSGCLEHYERMSGARDAYVGHDDFGQRWKN